MRTHVSKRIPSRSAGRPLETKAHLTRVTRPLVASADECWSLAACKEAVLEAIAGPQPKAVRRRK